MDFLADGRETSVDESAQDVIAFIRDVVETYPHLREGILKKLIHESLSRIQHEEVYRAALWIISEYAQNKSDIEAALHAIHSALGDLPLVSTTTSSSSEQNFVSDASLTTTGRSVGGSSGNTNTSTAFSSLSTHTITSPRPSGPRILADGTYATETALSLIASTPSKTIHSQSRVSTTSSLPPLRRLLTVTHPDTPQRMRGLLAGVVGVTLLKLTLRALTLLGSSDSLSSARHRLIARTLYMLTCLRQLPDLESDNDTRLAQCILILLYPHRYAMVSQLYLDSLTRSAFAEALSETHKKRAADEAASLARYAQQEREQSFEHPDAPIRFRHLLARASTHDFEGDDDFEGNYYQQRLSSLFVML
jgi:coatomer subunit beta